MITRLLALVGLLAVSSSASAASDLVTSLAAPSGVHVYQTGRYYASVSNIGNQSASSVSITIQMPQTATTPVGMMGTLSGYSSGCSFSTSNFRLTCSVGTVKRSKSAQVYFDLALPESTNALVLTTTATTISSENSTTNNASSLTPNLLSYAVPFAAPRDIQVQHCTGTGLSSFYECLLFPSSLSGFGATLNANQSLSFEDGVGPEYTGVWSSEGVDHLELLLYENGLEAAHFEGYGVSSTCWEGLTTFPGSTYVSMYQVCLQ